MLGGVATQPRRSSAAVHVEHVEARPGGEPDVRLWVALPPVGDHRRIYGGVLDAMGCERADRMLADPLAIRRPTRASDRGWLVFVLSLDRVVERHHRDAPARIFERRSAQRARFGPAPAPEDLDSLAGNQRHRVPTLAGLMD